jgi:hypothetical protein
MVCKTIIPGSNPGAASKISAQCDVPFAFVSLIEKGVFGRESGLF